MPKPTQGVLDFFDNAWGKGKLGILLECGKNFFPGVTCRSRVPEPQAGNPIGVDVLGGPLQLCKDSEGMSGIVGVRMSDLEKDRLVALDNEATVRIHSPPV